MWTTMSLLADLVSCHFYEESMAFHKAQPETSVMHSSSSVIMLRSIKLQKQTAE